MPFLVAINSLIRLTRRRPPASFGPRTEMGRRGRRSKRERPPALWRPDYSRRLLLALSIGGRGAGEWGRPGSRPPLKEQENRSKIDFFGLQGHLPPFQARPLARLCAVPCREQRWLLYFCLSFSARKEEGERGNLLVGRRRRKKESGLSPNVSNHHTQFGGRTKHSARGK